MSEDSADHELVNEFARASTLVWSLASALMDADDYHKVPDKSDALAVKEGIDLRRHKLGHILLGMPMKDKHTKEITIVQIDNNNNFCAFSMMTDMYGQIPSKLSGDLDYETELTKVVHMSSLLKAALKATVSD